MQSGVLASWVRKKIELHSPGGTGRISSPSLIIVVIGIFILILIKTDDTPCRFWWCVCSLAQSGQGLSCALGACCLML